MSQKITPFLWFDNNAKEAIEFYRSVFKDSKIISERSDGGFYTAEFELEGQRFMAINAGPHFKFNEAISMFVECEDQAEVDYYWNILTADGGEESMCGWLKDKFGLSWQIIPKRLGELINDADSEKAGRAVQAMLKMKKIVIEDLEKAYNG